MFAQDFKNSYLWVNYDLIWVVLEDELNYDEIEKMAKENGIAFTKVFKCRESNCHPFQYGGFFVCNDCGNKGVDKEWWKIQVEKDGNEFCCHGLDFVNLQESENYAFGKTFDEAISNYGTAMLRVSANGS